MSDLESVLVCEETVGMFALLLILTFVIVVYFFTGFVDTPEKMERVLAGIRQACE